MFSWTRSPFIIGDRSPSVGGRIVAGESDARPSCERQRAFHLREVDGFARVPRFYARPPEKRGPPDSLSEAGNTRSTRALKSARGDAEQTRPGA